MPMPVPKGTPPKDWVRKELTQCQRCYKSRMSGGAKLSKCGGCKIAQYCSRECQKADWQKHKDQCKSNQLLHEACPEYASEIAHLRAFCAKHRPSITDFSIRAMDLALDTTRGLRDFVFIEVERVPGEKRIERAYKVKDALVMPFALLDKEDAEMYRDGMAEYHAEQQASPGQISGIFVLVANTKTSVINVCPVSFGDDIYTIKPGGPWKQPLMWAINNGITF